MGPRSTWDHQQHEYYAKSFHGRSVRIRRGACCRAEGRGTAPAISGGRPDEIGVVRGAGAGGSEAGGHFPLGTAPYLQRRSGVGAMAAPTRALVGAVGGDSARAGNRHSMDPSRVAAGREPATERVPSRAGRCSIPDRDTRGFGRRVRLHASPAPGPTATAYREPRPGSSETASSVARAASSSDFSRRWR